MPTRQPPTAFDFDRPGANEPSSYDALTDLFLGDDTREPRDESTGTRPAAAMPEKTAAVPAPDHRPAGSPRPARAIVDVLVMGHLPVRTSPWAAQYARAAAEELGMPAALIRLHDGTLSIDVFGLPPSQRELHAREDGMGAIEHAKSLGAAWIVQGDESEAPADGVDPRLARADRVTLLCAGNEAAVVAAFQTIKSLATSLPGGVSSPEMRVCVMGAPAEHAESISRRLRDAAQMFLKRRVSAGPNVSRMGPTGAAPVFRGPCSLSAGSLMSLLVSPARPVADSSANGPAAPARPETVQRSAPGTANPAGVAASAAKPANEVRTPDTAPLPSLAARVEGLSLLNFRCPDDARVEFARDAAGGLHLLCAGDSGDAVRSLATAAAWAAKHASLLAMVSPGLRSETPVQHLFTGEPSRWRGMLDSSVRLHLLASVQVEGKTGWCCVALN